MKKKIIHIMKLITNNPIVNITVGMLILLSGIIEVIQSVESLAIGAHHGVIIFGIFQVLKSLPDIFDGMEYLQQLDEN